MSMKIGTTIRAYRLQKGLSQGDIEKKTGLLRCYLSRVENGHTVPSLDTLSKIALALDLPIAQFFASDTLGRQMNPPEAVRRRTALPHPDSPLLLKPERERPQAAAGHGEEVRRHCCAINEVSAALRLRSRFRFFFGAAPHGQCRSRTTPAVQHHHGDRQPHSHWDFAAR